MIQNNIYQLDPENAVNKIVSEIQRHNQYKVKRLLISLDGRSGTGKSTLARMVAEKVNGVVVVSDDFYSGGNDDKWNGYTPQAKAEQVIDWKKLRQVLEPLKDGKVASWHPLDFEPGIGWVGWKEKLITLEPADVILLEGAYSGRTELRDIVDLSVLIESPEEIRRKRLREREGEEYMKKWHSIWDEAEEYYFTQVRPITSFDLVIQLL